MQLYGNEQEVGRAVKASELQREEIFVTTKLWESEWGYRKCTGAIQDRLAALDLDFIDLLILHTPGNPRLRAETWKALEDAFSQVASYSIIKMISICTSALASLALATDRRLLRRPLDFLFKISTADVPLMNKILKVLLLGHRQLFPSDTT